MKPIPISLLLLATAAVQFLAAAQTTPAKPYTFDVVSIRQSPPGGPTPTQMPQFGPTANGYQSKGLPLITTILRAFIPPSDPQAYYTTDRIKGAPDWVTSTPYVVDAKIAEADLPAWQDLPHRKVMLATMLQAWLTNCCKLTTHGESREATVFNLIVAKGGLKIIESAPDANTPGFVLAGGGSVISGAGGRLEFHATPMASLAQVLSGRVGYPVVDKTGLTARYDFVLERDEQPEGAAPNPGPPTYQIDALGLHLDKTRGLVDVLFIDHIEKPVDN